MTSLEPIRILYVCTYWGARSQIAQALTTALELENINVHCAGLESGKIGPLVHEAMARRGLSLEAMSPPTVFNQVRQALPFDYVVTLCNYGSEENHQVLLEVIDQLFGHSAKLLHWDIPDFMSINAEGTERAAAADAIVATIAEHVAQMLQSESLLQSDSLAATVPTLAARVSGKTPAQQLLMGGV